MHDDKLKEGIGTQSSIENEWEREQASLEIAKRAVEGWVIATNQLLTTQKADIKDTKGIAPKLEAELKKLPVQLQMSIENKLKSEQENEQMTFIIEREKKQLVFNIEKEKMEADRKTIEANGIKAFQDIVSKGISKELIGWKAIEATEKLAKSPNTKIVVIGNKDTGGLPIIFPVEK